MRNALHIFSLMLLPLFAAGGVRAAEVGGVEFFETKIRPVLAENCYSCHSAAAKKIKGNLRLDTREGILKGGESDTPAVAPGKIDDSTLIRAIRWSDEALQMPPKKKLTPAQIADFEAWVKMGAPMPAGATTTAVAVHPTMLSLEDGRKFWSFIPPRMTPPPRVSNASWPHNDIDRFVPAKLEAKKLAPSQAADKRVLIRRATYDLIGLPPTLKEIDDFVNDASEDAFAKVIDRLLASPHYGERWGRHWLDVARYADTKGYVFGEDRRYPFAYTYRDWVVNSLNNDLPYDQFLVDQIAADRIDRKGDDRTLAALGFLTVGRRFINVQQDIIDDRIDVVCRGTMALTVGCARCHDHKYDPIPTADYYSLYGVFASTNEPKLGPLIPAPRPPQAAEFEAELAKRNSELNTFVAQRFAALSAEARTPKLIAAHLLAAQKTLRPQPIADEFDLPVDTELTGPWMSRRWEAFLKSAAERDDAVFALWRQFAALPPKQFAQQSMALVARARQSPLENPLIARFVLAGEPPKSLAQVADRYAAAIAAFDQPAPHPDPQIEAVRLVLNAPNSPVHIDIADAHHLFGNVDRMKHTALLEAIQVLVATHPGSPPRAMAVEDAPQPVTPHILKRGNLANVGAEVPRQFPAILSGDDRKPFVDGSGRLDLAKAIVSKNNPLTARVIVNRVWQYHFGYGLVRTPSDFGTRGSPPSHPELLDYLALRFEHEDGWSLKKLHRDIMLSAAYQQASMDRPDARQVDPENRLLWRQNPQRLDFESMRDSLLATSGQIDLTLGGPAIDIFAAPFVPRRSVYAYIDRQNLPGEFRTFDFASPDATSGGRFSTTVPQQALFMMNSPFVIEQAKKVASRKDVSQTTDSSRHVEALYRTILGRAPSAKETQLAMKFVQSEESQPPTPSIANAAQWAYGYGHFDDASNRITSFTRLPHFSGSAWDGGETMPDPKLGWAMLSANGGHVGNDLDHAVIRRFTVPRDCTVAVEGSLTHEKVEGDGIRGRIVSSREGALATWSLHHKSADTRVTGISLKQGDTLDFVVDCGPHGDYSYDGFNWDVTITKEAAAGAVAGDDTGSKWNCTTDFAGPATPLSKPMTAWEKLAQVLLESNEFAFVD